MSDTYLQVVNKVLRRLRSSEVNSFSDRAYSRLVGDFVNQALREVENKDYWSDLRTTTTLSLTATTQRYSLTDWQDRGRIDEVRNETRSREKIFLKSNTEFDGLWTPTQSGIPCFYRIGPQDGAGDPTIDFWPIPNASFTVSVTGWVGQGDITADGTVIKVPSPPVELRALALALEERGEDAGISFNEAMEQYDIALFEAMERDGASREGGRIPVWSLP